MCSHSYSAPKPKALPPPPPPANEGAMAPVINEGYGVSQKLVDLRNSNSLIVPFTPTPPPVDGRSVDDIHREHQLLLDNTTINSDNFNTLGLGDRRAVAAAGAARNRQAQRK